MKIIVNDISCSVEDSMLLPAVREICKARPHGYQFHPRYKKHMWDGYISLMYSFRKFPTGLLDLVVDSLRSANHNVELDDKRIKLNSREIIPECLSGISLRDYQVKAAEMLISKTRGVAKMATNSGKTEVMAAVIWGLNFPKTLVLVHRKELMYQTAERFSTRLGCEIGIIGDGKHIKKDITVAMIQTISNKFKQKDWIDNQVIMVDEVHHISSNQMMNFLKIMPGSYRYGLSGTPLKYDDLSDMKLMSATGDIAFEISNDFLIREGYSAKPIVNIHTVSTDIENAWDMNYPEAYEEFIVNNMQRNKIISNIAKSSSGITLILVNRLDHANKLQSMIPLSTVVNGSDSTEFRREVLDRMRTDSWGVFISSPILDEGIDVPGMNTVILAGGGKSHVKLLQRIGRGLRRKSEGENILIIHDFLDDTNKHLFSHSENRIETYVQEGFKKQLSSD
jgi:superfamily II DNA or RNA helicase